MLSVSKEKRRKFQLTPLDFRPLLYRVQSPEEGALSIQIQDQFSEFGPIFWPDLVSVVAN